LLPAPIDPSMHPAVEQYLAMDSATQKRVQVLLCQQALQVWEQLVPTHLTYRESVVGTEQKLDASLPRAALVAVVSGQDAKAIKARYLEPIVALEDEDIVLPKRAEFAYYAIYNLFSAQVLQQPLDPWLVPNQALTAIGDEAAGSALERALGAPQGS
jgi:hypothetical protein